MLKRLGDCIDGLTGNEVNEREVSESSARDSKKPGALNTNGFHWKAKAGKEETRRTLGFDEGRKN